jgi:hypothetical protein
MTTDTLPADLDTYRSTRRRGEADEVAERRLHERLHAEARGRGASLRDRGELDALVGE